jgi:hydrogenase-4 component F
MLLMAYVAVGAAAVALLFATKYHRLMQLTTIAHAGCHLLLAAYVLTQFSLPIQGLGGGYFFMDHLGLYEVLIASLIFILAGIYAGGYVESLMEDGELKRGNLRMFYLSFNILLIATVFSFFADNLALFWIFAEITTFFSALLIAILNSKKNIEASLRYIFVTSIAMLFSFIGLILLYTLTQHTLGEGTLSWTAILESAGRFHPKLLMATFILVFVGFAAKSGISPFHTWLPHAHAKAPSSVSAILSGVLLNVGVYGILRMYAIMRQTDAAQQASHLLVAFGVLSMAVAAFTMLRQKNLKKLIAFSSIEHMGIILAGMGLGTPAAVFWVLYHTLAHSLTKTLLFFSAGILHRQYHSNKAEDMKDAFRLQPVASAGLILGAAAIVGMPPFPVFTSKLLIMVEMWNASAALLLAVLILLLIASAALAIFMLRVFSPAGEHDGGGHVRQYRVHAEMKAPIIALVVMLVILGLFFPRGLENVLYSIIAELRL